MQLIQVDIYRRVECIRTKYSQSLCQTRVGMVAALLESCVRLQNLKIKKWDSSPLAAHGGERRYSVG